jgi:hypothetical protein
MDTEVYVEITTWDTLNLILILSLNHMQSYFETKTFVPALIELSCIN